MQLSFPNRWALAGVVLVGCAVLGCKQQEQEEQGDLPVVEYAAPPPADPSQAQPAAPSTESTAGSRYDEEFEQDFRNDDIDDDVEDGVDVDAGPVDVNVDEDGVNVNVGGDDVDGERY